MEKFLTQNEIDVEGTVKNIIYFTPSYKKRHGKDCAIEEKH